MPSEFWHDVDAEWSEIHPELIEDVFTNLLNEMEAGGYIGPNTGGGGGGYPIGPGSGGGGGGGRLWDDEDEDEDEDEPEPPRRRRRRRRSEPARPAIIERVTGFFRRFFRGR